MGTSLAPCQNMANEKIKKTDKDENEVLDTSGGEMPNPNQKMTEKASDAAKAFEPQVNPKISPQVHPKEEKEKKAG